MDKDIDRIQKNPDTDIVIRVDEYLGKKGLTIREFVKSERYTGFTKAGTRIPADKFIAFRKAINSIDEKDLEEVASSVAVQETNETESVKEQPKADESKNQKKLVKQDVEELEF